MLSLPVPMTISQIEQPEKDQNRKRETCNAILLTAARGFFLLPVEFMIHLMKQPEIERKGTARNRDASGDRSTQEEEENQWGKKQLACIRERARTRVNNRKKNRDTMVENGKKHKINSHLLIHRPTSGGRERSEHSGASERVSSVSERANGWASGPVL